MDVRGDRRRVADERARARVDGRWTRRERGAAVVEFAIVAPLLLVLLMGIVEFGLNLSNQIALRQGVREAARQGTVADFGSTDACGADLVQQGSADMRKLICLTKDRSDLSGTDVAVAVRFDPGADAYPASSDASAAPVGNGLIICSVAPMESPSRLFGPVVEDRWIRSKAVMRIEKSSGVAEQEASEADPTGEGWSWCTA